MFNIQTKAFSRILSVILVCVLVATQPVMAVTESQVQPYSSDYLQMYNTYVWAAGNGKVQVWFTVYGAQLMEELGVTTIVLQESTNQVAWRTVKVFNHANYDSMLGYDTMFHSGHVEYDGTAGRYYRAYVTIWGGRNGGGDSRRIMTTVELAT